MGSFLVGWVHERAVPKWHFLRELQPVVDWSAFTEQLVSLYQGKGEIGRPPHNPVVILKMLAPAYLHG